MLAFLLEKGAEDSNVAAPTLSEEDKKGASQALRLSRV
jgi:hypothetical protein